VVWQGDDSALAAVLARGCWSSQLRFGAGAAEWRLEEPGPDSFALRLGDDPPRALRLVLPGRHNALNATAALAASAVAGVAPDAGLAALRDFSGVRRRLDLRGIAAGVAVYDDFAHHPTAIAATIAALRSRLDGGRLLAVLESRSNTMRAGVHRDTLATSLAAADASYLHAPPSLGWDLAAATVTLGERRTLLPSVLALVDALVRDARPGDHVLVMSNGGFERIHERLLAALATRAGGAAQ
jgi:UDP-N-acetylmuramate: L-alanyl-gamma-D-glutamyl-meso-diaminopimelate ligase